MENSFSFIEDINNKYFVIESELEQKLKKLEQEEQQFIANNPDLIKNGKELIENDQISLEEAIKRNQNLLKNLEKTKAKLRSRATFTPLEIILEKAIKNYQKQQSLVPLKK